MLFFNFSSLTKHVSIVVHQFKLSNELLTCDGSLRTSPMFLFQLRNEKIVWPKLKNQNPQWEKSPKKQPVGVYF